MAAKSTVNRGKPRKKIAKPSLRAEAKLTVNVTQMTEWFEYALKAGQSMPSGEQIKTFHRHVIEVLEHSNLQAGYLKGRDWREYKFQVECAILEESIVRVRAAARDMEKNDGPVLWVNSEGELWAADLEEQLRQVKNPMIPDPAPAHRTREYWHVAGQKIADLLTKVLTEAGNTKILKRTNENSAVAVIGAKIISATYHKICAAGFASAMRSRSRGRSRSFEERYPGAAKIRTLD